MATANRTIVIYGIGEPSPLSLRVPTGLEFLLSLTVLDQSLAPVDYSAAPPQAVLLPRSQGGAFAYDFAAVDGQAGVFNAMFPGGTFNDRRGYSLEVYARRLAETEGDPLVPTTLLAKGSVVIDGSAYQAHSPLAPIVVPTVIGPQGPQGIQGIPGETGARGSIWTTGNGPPSAQGTEVPGDMYLDENNGDVWRWDGAAWLMGTFT
jgi:hypothetical protein